MFSLYRNGNKFLWVNYSDSSFLINMWSDSPVLNSITKPIRHNQIYPSLTQLLQRWPDTTLIGTAKNPTIIMDQFPELFI